MLKVADIAMVGRCLFGQEAIALGDRGYRTKNRSIDDLRKKGDLFLATTKACWRNAGGGVVHLLCMLPLVWSAVESRLFFFGL